MITLYLYLCQYLCVNHSKITILIVGSIFRTLFGPLHMCTGLKLVDICGL